MSTEAPCPTCGVTRHLYGIKTNTDGRVEKLWACWACAYEGQRLRMVNLERELVRANEELAILRNRRAT